MIPVFNNIATRYPITLNTFGPFKNPSNTFTISQNINEINIDTTTDMILFFKMTLKT